MESERTPGQTHRPSVVHCKVYARCLHSTCALYRYLLGLKPDPMLFGSADDNAPKVLISARRSQPDADRILRCDIAQVFFQLRVGQFARYDLPTRDQG